MNSVSSFGNSAITLQFALDRDIDGAAQDVQAAINAAGGVLPKDIPNPPTYAKVNPADTPILTLALTSDTLPLEQGQRPRRHRARAKAQRGHRRRPGHDRGQPKAGRAGAINPAGARRARPQPGGRAHRAGARITSTSPRAASTARGSPTPSARTTRFSPPRNIATSIVAYRNGAPVRLRDIGQVVDNVENVRLAGVGRTASPP